MDTRILTKKSGGGGAEAKGTLVHPGADWERGYSVHFFFDSRLVHCAVVPLTGDMGTDGSKHVLGTISAVKWDDVEFEAEEEEDAPPPPPPPATTAATAEKKRKRAATADDA